MPMRKEKKKEKKMKRNFKWEPIKMNFEQMRAVSSEDVEKLVYIVRGCARDERQVVSLSPLFLYRSLYPRKKERDSEYFHSPCN